ncbi:pentatricopeptide repeat-containing protein 2, mitochondrial-like isoform X1 [Pollicipes pollicipes]|uniref:pentatricopeptide repeat-containing protein 2, mitochondrial-like isoform X1 n=1 Tax=Pollicipes pollicipes TaxID=41117 RepID=UPI0018850855|nr:pentatricopeptide repeat-containing protein 2, mitochondrial-like isoform X1 [Pollicipes pollicipes]
MMFSIIPSSLRALGRRRDAVSQHARTLFGAGRLGVDEYRQRRTQVGRRLADSKDELHQRLEKFASGLERMAFSEELRQLVHVAEAEEQDQVLLTRMITRLHSQASSVRFGSFVFGPVVMRMYWHHQLADQALQAFRNPELDGFFDQLTSFTLLLDLLYKQGRYQDVLDTFDEVQTRQLHGSKYPADCVALAMAACYQLNSAASFEYVRDLLLRLEEVGHATSPRAVALAAALLLRQGAPDEALRLLRRRRDTAKPLLRDLLALSLADLDRPAEAVETLGQPLLADLPYKLRDGFAVVSDAVDRVEASVQRKNDAQVNAKWQSVKQGLQSYGLTRDATLEDALTSPILGLRKRPAPNDVGASFNRGQRARRTPTRPGLSDMED